MSLYKKHRALSEKTTSIEDPIEVVQRGVISFVPSKGRVFLIPTHIKNVVKLSITPLSEVTAAALSASGKAQGWYSDYSLHYSTNAASSGFGSIASNVTDSEVGGRLRIVNNKLYVATASMAANSASNTGVTSTASTSWRLLEEFPSDAKNYLVVNIANSASTYFKAKKQKLSYEVVGYEF